MRLRFWTLVLCILSTTVYLLFVPLSLLMGVRAMGSLGNLPLILCLFALPIGAPIAMVMAWRAYRVESYSTARLYCYVPALLFLMVYAVVALVI